MKKGDSHRREAGAPDALRREGRIRYVGPVTLAADQLEQALSLTGIASVPNRFHLLDRGSDAVRKMRAPGDLPAHDAVAPRDTVEEALAPA